jgi:hypothetical protein
MPRLIDAPIVVEAAGTRPKLIEEFVGRSSTGTTAVSVARMRSPSGWEEPGQRLAFQEITVVLKGSLRVAFEGGRLDSPDGSSRRLTKTKETTCRSDSW